MAHITPIYKAPRGQIQKGKNYILDFFQYRKSQADSRAVFQAVVWPYELNPNFPGRPLFIQLVPGNPLLSFSKMPFNLSRLTESKASLTSTEAKYTTLFWPLFKSPATDDAKFVHTLTEEVRHIGLPRLFHLIIIIYVINHSWLDLFPQIRDKKGQNCPTLTLCSILPFGSTDSGWLFFLSQCSSRSSSLRGARSRFLGLLSSGVDFTEGKLLAAGQGSLQILCKKLYN